MGCTGWRSVRPKPCSASRVTPRRGATSSRPAPARVSGSSRWANVPGPRGAGGARPGRRRIVANVQKGLVFLVSTHVALLGFILIATLAGYDRPLLPLQILWLELFIDLSTSIAFEREPEEPGAMRRPPRPRAPAPGRC